MCPNRFKYFPAIVESVKTVISWRHAQFKQTALLQRLVRLLEIWRKHGIKTVYLVATEMKELYNYDSPCLN